MQSILKNNIREIIYNQKETNNKKYAKKEIKESVSMALWFVPIIGNAKGIIDAIVGKDLIRDEELSILGRVYAGFFIITHNRWFYIMGKLGYQNIKKIIWFLIPF